MYTKTLEQADTQIKAVAEGEYQFEGYASVFNQVDAVKDSIAPGAYTKTLERRERPIAMHLNHKNEVLIGKWLEFQEDEHGLFARGELTKGHSLAEDTYASLKHGVLTSMSIGFRLNDYEKRSDGVRLLKDIDLVEVSLVNRPADLQAQVSSVKEFNELLEDIDSVKSLEHFFRKEFDLSQSKSKRLIACIKSQFDGQREVDPNQTLQRDVEAEKQALQAALIEKIRAFNV